MANLRENDDAVTVARTHLANGCEGRVLINSCLDLWLNAGNCPAQLLDGPVTLIKETARLSTGRALLSGVDLQGREEIFVKAYRPSILKRWGNWLSGRYRARSVWETSWQLITANVPVPEPLGYFVYTRGTRQGDSYFCCRVLTECDNIRQIAAADSCRFEGMIANGFFERCVHDICQFHAAGFVHRDLKWTNIQVDRDTDRIWFTDLDATRRRVRGTKGQSEAVQDLVRFVADAADGHCYDEIRDRCVACYSRERNLSDAVLRDRADRFVDRRRSRNP